MDIESIEQHIRNLTNQHTSLERQLEKIMRQKSWNEYEVEDMKKKKLLIKDELSRLYRMRHDMMQEHDYD